MESPPASKRATTVRRHDDRDPFRDGIGVDGERKHQ